MDITTGFEPVVVGSIPTGRTLLIFMNIPKEVLQIAEILKQAGHQAYLVGGCVRDLLLRVEPKDWDITTSAKPEVVLKLFPDSVYENQFGTVGVKTESENPRFKIVEVTTFRLEGKYTDKRHPDEVKFVKTVEEDLSRRDFTVNALALSLTEGMALNLGVVGNDGDARDVGNVEKAQVLPAGRQGSRSNKRSDQISRTLIDPFGGQKDLKAKIIRAVGDPEERFTEDALRLLRAVRFSAQLDFKIEKETHVAMQKHAGLLEFISKERIRDEFSKLLMTTSGHWGVELMRELGLLQYVIPELLTGVGVEQNQHHIFSVYEHNLKSLQYAVEKNFLLELRLASLLHDVGKPKSRQWKNTLTGKKTRAGKKGDWTFYGHEVIGAKQAVAILERLKYSKDIIEHVSLLVYEHMFVYDPDVVTLSGVRRLLSRVGSENIEDLIKLREADRIGSGVPKAQPYRLRYLQAMIEKVKTDPISAKMIAIKGDEVIEVSGLIPGPAIGAIIAILLEEVLEDPKKNDKKQLVARVKELAKISEKKLIEMSHASKKRAATEQEKIDGEIKKKYFV